MKNGKNLGLQIIETSTDAKVSGKTYLDIESTNLDEIDLFAGRINSEIKKIKESPSVVYIKAAKETDGIYTATVPAIKDLIVDGLYIISLDQPNSTGVVNIRINGTISKNLNKVDIENSTLIALASNDLLANFEYFFRYNGDVFVLDNSNALSLNGKSLKKFVLKDEVVDNVISENKDVPLSANQGKILNERVTSEIKNLNDMIDSTAEDINTRIDTEVEAINTELDLRVKKSSVGVANGVAPTDENNIIPSRYLPSYVDDALEFDGIIMFPAVGESGKIYIDTLTELTYRWSGTQYVEISKSLALGETSSTAYAGDKGKKNADDISAINSILPTKINVVSDSINDRIAVLNTSGGVKTGAHTIEELATNESVDIKIAAIPVPDVSGQIGSHNTNGTAHSDIRNVVAGKADSSHTHVKSQISDFPVSLPANGGNADTVGGKPPADFALLTEMNAQLADKANRNEIPASLPANGGDSATVNGHTVDSNVPAGAQFTDTVYTHPANHPASMITGLASVATGGYVTAGQKAGTPVGERSTAEGSNTQATGYVSHAEGENTQAAGRISHTEGENTQAAGRTSHAEGYNTQAIGDYSHAEGSGNKAHNASCHAEGWNTVAGDPDYGAGEGGQYSASHAEGEQTIASGTTSHAEGWITRATGSRAHSEGSITEATGYASHAEGHETIANGERSHSGGQGTQAGAFQYAIGTYNIASSGSMGADANTSKFVIGNGTHSDARSNAFRVSSDGGVYGKRAYTASGADVAEFKEWMDGNPKSEDRRGLFVTFDGNRIRLATQDDDWILGVVSAHPVVVGNEFADEWCGRFMTDIFNKPIYKDYTIPAKLDDKGQVIEEERIVKWYVENPDYVPDQEYKPRKARKEWSYVSCVGELVMIDDGTCQVNGYCLPGENGIAMATADKRGYRVMLRKDDTHILVWAHGRIIL